MNSELLKSSDACSKIDHAYAVIELLIVVSDSDGFFVNNKIIIDALASASESLSIAKSMLKK